MTFAGMIETGMKTILRLFFDGLSSKNRTDLIQSNLRYKYYNKCDKSATNVTLV